MVLFDRTGMVMTNIYQAVKVKNQFKVRPFIGLC